MIAGKKKTLKKGDEERRGTRGAQKLSRRKKPLVGAAGSASEFETAEGRIGRQRGAGKISLKYVGKEKRRCGRKQTGGRRP